VKRTQVQEVMTTEVVAVLTNTSFSEIVARLVGDRVTAVPVLDSDGKVVGIVSDADLVIKEATPDMSGEARLPGHRRHRRKAGASTAAEVMSAPARTIWPTATVADAAQLMAEYHIRRLPVVDPADGHLVGIVSRADLLRVYLRSDEGIKAEIRTEVLPKMTGQDPRGFTIAVHHGFVTITGQVEFRSSLRAMDSAISRIEGVVGVDSHLTYRRDAFAVGGDVLDDRFERGGNVF
jgi:CBS domain-containing protein